MRPNTQLNLFSYLSKSEIEKRTAGLKIEFLDLEKTKESEYEISVKELAVADNYAKRAARDKFLKKQSVIMLIDGGFAGFGIYQADKRASQFYIWQIAITDKWKGLGLAKVLVEKMLNKNVMKFPSIVTVFDQNEVSLSLFQSCGFEIYQKKSTVYYMARGGIIDGKEIESREFSRIKLLLGMNPTNIWNSAKGDWISEKQNWNELIEHEGYKAGIVNPAYATREGCWLKDGGLAKFATGEALNSGASVLDPVACECIIRFFTAGDNKRIYNPFGGGVQFGFVAGSCGHEYVASEIRQNQCDANNKICEKFNAKWIKEDSSKYYNKKEKFDLVFSCPPYYKVEDYRDYDKEKPKNEINGFDTYEKFKTALFEGYKNAIKMLNDNCFMVIMVGDSRDPKTGGYYCIESETEIFLKEQGLHIYNRIVYLEHQFTKAMQIRLTIDSRKLPKSEQKIIVAYKGDTKKVKDFYPSIGRI